MNVTAAFLFLSPATGVAVLLAGLDMDGALGLGAGVFLVVGAALGGAAAERRFV